MIDFDLLTPKEIVNELDKYIIGQKDAKKAVAIAVRNRIRRQRLSEKWRKEVLPKNILMIGPTGVGKTEIARRLAQLSGSPFLKVEATRFTEVGYVGKNVDSMIRDLVEISINMVKKQRMEEVKEKAELMVEERILDALLPESKRRETTGLINILSGIQRHQPSTEERQNLRHKREELRQQLRSGKIEDHIIEVEIEQSSLPFTGIIGGGELEDLGIDLSNLFGSMLPKTKKKKKMTIAEARKVLLPLEAEKLVDMEKTTQEALDRAQNRGIVFIDELDKIAGKAAGSGPDVSRQGVQRDILPVVEGTTVVTKYGMVKTDHILFIASGAFHVSKPSDLIPELQGRFPIRVELDTLTTDDFIRILTEPENALIKQYTALIETEGVKITFTKGAIKEIANTATSVNERAENIGARRLQTIMSTLLEEILFSIPDKEITSVKITADDVKKCLADIVEDVDLSKYIL